MNEPVFVLNLMDIIAAALFFGALAIMGIMLLIAWWKGKK